MKALRTFNASNLTLTSSSANVRRSVSSASVISASINRNGQTLKIRSEASLNPVEDDADSCMIVLDISGVGIKRSKSACAILATS